jgi:hypothetical protein
MTMFKRAMRRILDPKFLAYIVVLVVTVFAVVKIGQHYALILYHQQVEQCQSSRQGRILQNIHIIPNDRHQSRILVDFASQAAIARRASYKLTHQKSDLTAALHYTHDAAELRSDQFPNLPLQDCAAIKRP